MSSCRGIIVAGLTNGARTQMAEALLRAFTGGRVFVCSGGVHHHCAVHPLAIAAMAEVGLDVSRQSPSSLEAARRQRDTFDVYVSVDAPYAERGSDRYQRRSPDVDDGGGSATTTQPCASSSLGLSTPAACSGADALLVPPTPAHWAVVRDAADARQSWTLWSPRDPRIFHERSTRKLQDHLYEGEPLFMRLRPHELRAACRVRRRWEVAEVSQRYAMESVGEQRHRVAQARDRLGRLALALISDLEDVYGEAMLDKAAAAAFMAATSAAAPAATEATVL
ncbi:Low molecular weight phosphotyrosine protein phosphatase [Novymonas esmeraldas]|uniref:Low molecular weight phosphotyrosine protein phosphatase n=1 Tax=Novymonas esmeraldas TaxID=1808958 RepID=A0AAW0EMI0_9TRYP